MENTKHTDSGYTAIEVVTLTVFSVAVIGAVALFILNQADSSTKAALTDQVTTTYEMSQAAMQTGGKVPTGLAPPNVPIDLQPVGTVAAAYPMIIVGNSPDTLCIDGYDNRNNTVTISADGTLTQPCPKQGPDSDADGYSDLYETLTGANPADPASTPWTDDDVDGYSNIVETNANTNPTERLSSPTPTAGDSDGDGFADVTETIFGSNAMSSLSTPGDINQDGLMDPPPFR